MVIKVDPESTYLVSPDFTPSIIPEGYVWDETAFQELIKATDKATAEQTIYTYGGPQGGSDVDYLNAADLTISDEKYNGEGQVVDTTITANAFNNAGTVTTEGTIAFSVKSFTNFGEFNLDKNGEMTATSAVMNMEDGTINLNAGSTLQGSTVVNAGTITVVSDHAAINGAITNNGIINALMKKLTVDGDIQNANKDDARIVRNASVIKAREFEVAGNVVNYGAIGGESIPVNTMTVTGALSTYNYLKATVLTADSILNDSIQSEVEGEGSRGFIDAGEINAGSVDNVSGIIMTGTSKETGVGINVTGTINNGSADIVIPAKINAGTNGWIKAASINNIGTDIENSLITAGKITVADIVNNGGFSTRIIENTGTITNNATGLFAVIYIDDPIVTGFVEGASINAGTIINGGTFAVYSEAALPTPVSVTKIENNALFEFSGEGFTLTGDIVNNANGQLDVAGTVTGATATITNSGTFNISNDDDVSGVLTADAVTNTETGTINLNAGSTLAGSTVVNSGTITVVSDHAAINGAISNHGMIDAMMKKLTVTGDIQNAEADDTAKARDNSVIKSKEFEVTGNVTNYGIIGTEWKPDHEITISGELRNYRQVMADTLTAGSIYNNEIYSDIKEERAVGYIVVGQITTGEINNVVGMISAGEAEEQGIGVNVSGKINNGKVDNDDEFNATIQAGDDGWIQAVDALNNIGATSYIHSGEITVVKGTEAGDLTNDGRIAAKNITVAGAITNSATGIIDIGSSAVISGNLSATSIANAGVISLADSGTTLTGDVVNSNQFNFEGTVTATGSITNAETGTISIKSAGAIADTGTITNSGTLHIAILEGNETKITADKFYNTEGVGKITIGGSCDDGITTVISATEGDVNISDITVSATAKSGGEVTAVTRGGSVVLAAGVDYGTIYLSNGIDEVADFAKEVKDSAGASFYVDFTAFKLPASALTDGVRDTTTTVLIDGSNAAALKYASETTASIDGLAFTKDGTNAATPEDEEKNVEFVLTGMDQTDPESCRELKKGITVGAGVTFTADNLYQSGEDAVTNIDGELRIGTYDSGYDSFLIAGGAVNVSSAGSLTGNGIVIVDAAQRDEAGDPITAALNVTGAAIDLSDLEIGANATVTLKDIALNADSSSRAVIDSIVLRKTDVVDFADPVLTISDSHVTANTVKIEAGTTLTVSCSAPGSSDLTVNGTLDFDISGAAAGGPALFEGLDHVLGAPTYTLTISGTEGKGTYSLATGAAGFDKSFTVVNTLGTELGTLAVNGAELNVDGKTYKLALNGSDLSVSIAFGNKPDDGTNDILYDKKTQKWNDENITVKTQITAAGDFVSLDEPGSVEQSVNGLVMHNMVGYNTPKCDTGDTASISVDAPAKLTFQIDSTVSGTFYVYEKVYDEKKKAYEQVQVGKVSVKKDKPAYLKNVCITDDGNYFVQMAANAGGYKKAGATAFYNVKVASARFFDAVDDGWNDAYANPLVQANPILIDREIPFVALDDNVLSDKDWNFVGGITDEADYAKLKLDDSAYVSFNVIGDAAASDGSAKFTVWQLNGSKSLKKLTSVTLKSDSYEQTTKGVFLDKDGEYYISMESTDAAKGKAVSYKVELNKLDSRIFDSADSGLNNELYNKATRKPYDDDGVTHHYATNAIGVGSKEVFLDYEPIGLEGYENFVGYGDKADYAKFTVTEQGKLSFTVTATEGATFEVWTLANGKMKSLGKAKLKLDEDEIVCTGTVSNLSLEVGTEYYVSMTAAKTTANAKGSVFYNVSATLTPQNASALAMPETASAASALAMPDDLSFARYDSDVLAGASASTLADLNDKAAWQSLLA